MEKLKFLIMSMLRFSDGESFDLSGPLRAEERYDGWYVIGQNMMIPVNSLKEANNRIEKIKSKR